MRHTFAGERESANKSVLAWILTVDCMKLAVLGRLDLLGQSKPCWRMEGIKGRFEHFGNLP